MVKILTPNRLHPDRHHLLSRPRFLHACLTLSRRCPRLHPDRHHLLSRPRFLRARLRLLILSHRHPRLHTDRHHLRPAPVTLFPVLCNLQHVTLCSAIRLHCLCFHLLSSPNLTMFTMKIIMSLLNHHHPFFIRSVILTNWKCAYLMLNLYAKTEKQMQ